MPNPEHLRILHMGVQRWNGWREHASEISPDLIHADLGAVNLSLADLSRVDLTQANLRGANLSGADLGDAILRGANLSRANLIAADLNFADLGGADLTGAALTDANLNNADLSLAGLRFADLSGANLSDANLSGADLHGADLRGADLNGAFLWKTGLASVDLSRVNGLENVIHAGPSAIGIDTLYLSHGEMPDAFLFGAGVPEEIIDLAHSIRTGPAIDSSSCFISYSTRDEEFARRLHSRMREAGLRVWLVPESLKVGKHRQQELLAAIQLHDRRLIVLSEHSLKSEWVMAEIRQALAAEKKEEQKRLFPVTLMGYAELKKWECPDSAAFKDLAGEIRKHQIPDFSTWQNRDAFEAAFALLRESLQPAPRRHPSKK